MAARHTVITIPPRVWTKLTNAPGGAKATLAWLSGAPKVHIAGTSGSAPAAADRGTLILTPFDTILAGTLADLFPGIAASVTEIYALVEAETQVSVSHG